MTGPVRRLLAMLALLVSTGATGAGDELGYRPFPQATIESSRQVEAVDSRIYLGAISEVNNELRSADEIRREWHGVRRLIGVGRRYSVDEVAAHYRAQIREKEATVLFSCEGRDCGESNVWANRVFGEASLYGRDEEQRYIVSAWPDVRNRIQVNTLYLVQRGNREVNVYEQAFRLPEGENLDGLEIGDRRVFGPIVLAWRNVESPSIEAEAADYERILDLAGQYPEGRLYLLGFSPLEEQSLASAMETTASAVALVRQVLSDRGLDSERMESRVLGPLVKTSEAGRTGRRVEVMLIREEP